MLAVVATGRVFADHIRCIVQSPHSHLHAGDCDLLDRVAGRRRWTRVRTASGAGAAVLPTASPARVRLTAAASTARVRLSAAVSTARVRLSAATTTVRRCAAPILCAAAIERWTR